MIYLVKDNFLDKTWLQFIKSQIRKNQGQLSRQGYNNIKTLRDQLDPRTAQTKVIQQIKSPLLAIWRQKFWNVMQQQNMDKKQSIYDHAQQSKQGSVLLSSYGDGDQYGYHVDTDMDSIVTAVLLVSLKKPAKFSGGNFKLQQQQIAFKDNRLIVFPSCKYHAVTKVALDQDIFQNRRFSIQYFISPSAYRGKFVDESNNK